MSKISSPLPARLMPLSRCEQHFPVKTDLVYAQPEHEENIFKTALYRHDADLWLESDFAAIVLHAAQIMHKHHGAYLILKDGLRPLEAQAAMLETDAVQENRWWVDGPNRMLSPPGRGGHPRGMAVDVAPADAETGRPWDMGTPFDYLTTDPADNPAARDYTDLPDAVLQNRRFLENAFRIAADNLNLPIHPLSNEWWDFRFPADKSNRFEPLSDRVLPPQMRMTSLEAPDSVPDFPDSHFEGKIEAIKTKLDNIWANTPHSGSGPNPYTAGNNDAPKL